MEKWEKYQPVEGFDTEKEGVVYGELKLIEYPSKTTGSVRKANVLLPVDYDTNKEYPVLYLLHGIGGDENEWLFGEPRNVIGNLVAAGEATNMLVVIPNVRARANDRYVPEDTFTMEHFKAFDNFINDLKNDLMPYIEANYSVMKGRENTAIAGLSMGGRESLNIGIKMADTFGYVGAFCPAPGVFPYERFNGEVRVAEAGLFTKEEFVLPEGTKSFVMINTGLEDGVVTVWPKTYHETLTANGVENEYYETPGGHDFVVWKNGLYNYAKRIFK